MTGLSKTAFTQGAFFPPGALVSFVFVGFAADRRYRRFFVLIRFCGWDKYIFMRRQIMKKIIALLLALVMVFALAA